MEKAKIVRQRCARKYSKMDVGCRDAKVSEVACLAPRDTAAHPNWYALRKQTPEPVFGIIKSVLGFRQFLLRGLDKVRGEWSLVTMAWNIKRMFTLSPRQVSCD